MKRILSGIVTIGAVLMSVTSKNVPGVTASIDLSLFEEAKDLYTEYLVEIVNDMALGDFKFDKNDGYLKDNKLEIS